MPNLFFEKEALKEGATIVCGVDEAGRGPVAGPVVAVACVMPFRRIIKDVKDSKMLSKNKREELFDRINCVAHEIGVGYVMPEKIDLVNILNATLEAMRNAILALPILPDFILVDGTFEIPVNGIFQKTVVKGDSKSYSIAAASIIAKVTRDRMMEMYDVLYPGYDFSKNAGYLSKKHLKAIEAIGPSPIHRMSFRPLRK
ncbi:ribonuclease HII [candidate division WOR-3 bacterium]|nr:ribonuclease HII [candidate division WOR-3 bacterium]